MELEQKILEQVKVAMGDAIVKELVGYNKPLSELTQKVIKDNEAELFTLINSEFKKLLTAAAFRKELKTALNAKLAKTLVSRMGGELEKQVNALKADPMTRAKITLAIDNVINAAAK